MLAWVSDVPAEVPVFERIGEAGIAAIVRAFYARVPADPVLGAMYPAADLAGAEHRLKEFLIYRFGGPVRYLHERGHPRLRQRHAPFQVDANARDHWLACMFAAVAEQSLDAEVVAWLRHFFADVATFLINR
jgi:hemoglobin